MTGSAATETEHQTAGDLLRRIVRRRSTPPRRLIAPGPLQSEVELIVEAACAAPDHKALQPFRFEWVGQEERPALADVFEAAERELDPSPPRRRLPESGSGRCTRPCSWR
jgi:nitroreductase